MHTISSPILESNLASLGISFNPIDITGNLTVSGSTITTTFVSGSTYQYNIVLQLSSINDGTLTASASFNNFHKSGSAVFDNFHNKVEQRNTTIPKALLKYSPTTTKELKIDKTNQYIVYDITKSLFDQIHKVSDSQLCDICVLNVLIRTTIKKDGFRIMSLVGSEDIYTTYEIDIEKYHPKYWIIDNKYHELYDIMCIDDLERIVKHIYSTSDSVFGSSSAGTTSSMTVISSSGLDGFHKPST